MPQGTHISEAEQRSRLHLARAYRLFDVFGWHELIYNHITLRVPDTHHFLINPFGLTYKKSHGKQLG